MTLLFLFLIIFGVLSCLPAWFASRRRGQAGGWSLLTVVPGLCCWILLAGLGVGPQSLSNLVVELFDLTLGAVILYYLKVFLLDRRSDPGRNTAYVVALTVCAAVLLRLLMPLLPE